MKCDLWMVILLTVQTYPRFLHYDAELALAELALAELPLPIVLYSRLQLQLDCITTVPTYRKSLDRQREDRHH